MQPCPPLPKEDLQHVLEHTRADWDEARGKTFFITGGTGFFGIWLLETFCEANDTLNLGAKLVVLSRNPEAFALKMPHLGNRNELSFIQGDVRDFAFPIGQFDYIIHAATEASAKLNAEAPEEMLNAIIAGTQHVLDFAAQCGVKKLLLTSSGAVYGPQPPEMTHIPEDYLGGPDPLSPGSAYAEGKRVAEHLCCVHARRHGYEAKIARCFAFVGPHLPLDAHFAIGNFIANNLRGEPIKIAGDGTPLRSYLYASDLAIWLWVLLFRGSTGRSFNVGSSYSLSIEEVANKVSATRKPTLPVDVSMPSLTRIISRYVPDTKRCYQELNLSVSVPIDLAINRTIQWFNFYAGNLD